MDHIDPAILELALKHDSEIKRLYDEHRRLDREITEIDSRAYLTETEEFEIKVLKKKKLRVKEELTRKLERYSGHLVAA
ncbi:MAG: DUF465 domain-containing protein [Candidatus Dadabacteria bacterium]|nr:MAG: DUF465 domain-containing protein [Candidatus Dadabacteria bacterium]